MSGVANKTAYSILAALEGQEDVDDESAIPELPEDEEAQKQREARAEARAEAQRRKAEAKAQLLAAQQSKAKQLPPKLMLPFEIIKRTRMCESWLGSGRCREGQDCVFAHDVQEMNANRARVRQYQADQYRKMGYTEYADQLLGKKKVPAFSQAGPGGSGGGTGTGASSGEGGRLVTKAGRQTGVLHESFKAGGQYYKTRLCRNYMHGRCTYGEVCSYAHGEADLRAHLPDPDAVEEELAKWGMLPRGNGTRRLEAGPSSSGSTHPYNQGGATPYSYIGEPAAAAAAGGALQYQQYQQPYAPAQQAQQQGAGGGMGAKEMDPAQLSALMEGLDFSDEEEHPAFLCPITHERLRDPVVAADGYTYERAAIEGWLSTRETSPMTNQKLDDKVLIPNLTLKEAMRVVLGDDW